MKTPRFLPLFFRKELLAIAVPAVLFVFCALLVSCGGREGQEGQAAAKPLVVYTTFYPTWFFTREIGGGHVQVVDPIPSDVDPIFYTPPPEMVRDYQEKADLIVLNGAGYAKWAANVMLPREKIVDAGAAFADELIIIKNATVHSHGKMGKHSHSGTDPHTWMDPTQAMEQCRAIAAALEKKDPAHAADYEAGLKKILARLKGLDDGFRALAKKGRKLPIVASPPAYNYICRHYGWEVKAFGFDPESKPELAEMKKLKDYLKDHPGIRYMVWEAIPIPEEADIFRKEFGLEPVEFSPVEVPPKKGEDYFAVMKRNLKNIEPLFENS